MSQTSQESTYVCLIDKGENSVIPPKWSLMPWEKIISSQVTLEMKFYTVSILKYGNSEVSSL